jgi:hypothetical protein
LDGYSIKKGRPAEPAAPPDGLFLSAAVIPIVAAAEMGHVAADDSNIGVAKLSPDYGPRIRF